MAERIEVGVLDFSCVSVPATGETIVDVPSGFSREIAAFKLTVNASGTTAESGVVFRVGGWAGDCDSRWCLSLFTRRAWGFVVATHLGAGVSLGTVRAFLSRSSSCLVPIKPENQ